MEYTQQSKTAILKSVHVLFTAYKEPLDKKVVGIYVESLSDIPLYILMAAIKKLINTHRFLPRIAEIRETAKMISDFSHSNTPDWSLAWTELENEVRRVGSYGYPNFNDPYLVEVVSRIGWRKICQTADRDWLILRAQFRDDYQTMVMMTIERQQCQAAVEQIVRNGASPELNQKMEALSQRLQIKA